MMTSEQTAETFSGHVYIFHAIDVGDDINLEAIRQSRTLATASLRLPKYFRNYHVPLAVELPHPHESTKLVSCKIHSFGAISLTYAIPFDDTLENLRKEIGALHNQYQEQSIIDSKALFKKLKPFITQPQFFHTQSHYTLLQVDPSANATVGDLQKKYGGVIASTLRFEKQTLSEYQKNEILESALGYFRGDLLIIDTDSAFICDKEYEEVLDLFEFANIQQLELRYFDRLLDQQLNKIYEGEGRSLHIRSYIPFVGTTRKDPIEALGKLKVDISVITERLESSIKLAGEPYFEEVYERLKERLGLTSLQQSIERKLQIVHDIRTSYQHKIDVTREDMLSVLIIALIFIELIVGVLHYMK